MDKKLIGGLTVSLVIIFWALSQNHYYCGFGFDWTLLFWFWSIFAWGLGNSLVIAKSIMFFEDFVEWRKEKDEKMKESNSKAFADK